MSYAHALHSGLELRTIKNLFVTTLWMYVYAFIGN